MTNRSLADSGLPRKRSFKPNVAIKVFGHRGGMTRKKIYRDKIRSPLQETFVRLVNDRMLAERMSDNQLAKICAQRSVPVGQTSISRITSGRQDPSLEIVYAIAVGLGVSPLVLLSDAFSSEAARTPSTRRLIPLVKNEQESQRESGLLDKPKSKKKA